MYSSFILKDKYEAKVNIESKNVKYSAHNTWQISNHEILEELK